MTGIVTAVSRSPNHTMSKPNQPAIRLVAGVGVEQDAHQGSDGQASLAAGDGRPSSPTCARST